MHIRLIVSYLCSPCIQLHQLNLSWKALQWTVPNWTGASAILCTALRLTATLGRSIMKTWVPVLWVPYTALFLPLITWLGCISPTAYLSETSCSLKATWSHRSLSDLEHMYYSEWEQRDMETEQTALSLQSLMTGTGVSLSSWSSWRLLHWIQIIAPLSERSQETLKQQSCSKSIGAGHSSQQWAFLTAAPKVGQQRNSPGKWDFLGRLSQGL